jgi:hypothetical protein
MDIQAAVAEASSGAIVRVPAGVHKGSLVIRKSVTLLGEPGAVLDGDKQGIVVRVEAPGAIVRLTNLTLTHGHGKAGGAIDFAEGRLEIVDCVLVENDAHSFGGGAIYAAGDSLWIVRTRLERNIGRQGGAILLDGVVEADLASCLIAQNAAVQGGGLRLREGARAHLMGCTVADNRVKGPDSGGSCLYLSGSTTRRPRAELVSCIIADADEGKAALWNQSPNPAELTIDRSVLPPALKGAAGVLESNHFGNPGFVGKGEHPYAIGGKSIAAGAGSPYAYEKQTTDLAGKPRLRSGMADAGAYSA